jgi:hypothetical protein
MGANTSDFAKMFGEGTEDVIDDLEFSRARRPNESSRRVNVDFLSWMVDSLDTARRICRDRSEDCFAGR